MFRVALLREAGGLGDVICTEPVVRGLREKYGEVEITYVGLPEYKGAVDLFCEKPDFYYEVFIQHRRKRDSELNFAEWKYLQDFKNHDMVVNLYCPGFRHEREMKDKTNKSRIRIFCEEAGVRPSVPRMVISEDDRIWADGWLSAMGFDPDKPLVGLQPISCGWRRNWNIKNWVNLSKRLNEEDIQTITFHTFINKIKMMEGIKATGLPLSRVGALISRCGVMVTPDSGLMHFAGALDVATISLWGITNPYVVGEYYKRLRHIWKRNSPNRPKDCRVPCYSMKGCISRACRGGCLLMNEITVEEVLGAVVGSF